MVEFVATVNVPGYLPMDDEPPTFDSAQEAWLWLATERVQSEDEFADLDAQGGYSACANTLGMVAHEGAYEDNGIDPVTGCGTVYGPTPGSDSEHDLGLAYSVSVVE